VYDLALGDEVETDDDRTIQPVVKPTGHYTFRVWFGESPDDAVREQVLGMVQRFACLSEWSSANLLAIDALNAEVAEDVSNFLPEREQHGHLGCETGRT